MVGEDLYLQQQQQEEEEEKKTIKAFVAFV